MQSQRYSMTEQAGAVRDLYKSAEEAYFFAGELQAEVMDHGRNALIFLKGWAERPELDPSQIRESFARVEMIHRLLGGLLDQQRRALEVLPARLTFLEGADLEREARARAQTLAQLELEGILGGHRAPVGQPRARPQVHDPSQGGLEE